MLGQIAKLFKSARNNDNETTGQEHLQPDHTANSSAKAHTLEWQPLDVTKLNITADKVRQIEASMVKNARDEFANVMKEFNSSQNARKVTTNK